MYRWSFTPTISLFFLLIGLIFMMGSAAADITGNGEFGSIGFAAYQGIEDKSTIGVEQVPDMTLRVDFGKKRTQAIIEFCAEGNMFNTHTGSPADHGSVQVTALVDGMQMGDRIQFFTFENFSALPHCYRWVSTPFSGIHTVTIDWELLGTDITARLHDRILTVHSQ